MLAYSQNPHVIRLDRDDNRRGIVVRLFYCGIVEEEKAQTIPRDRERDFDGIVTQSVIIAY